jgi:hypothetical protein
MLSLVIAVVAIALPDSINPSLIAGELVAAGGRHPGMRALAFTVSAFVVTLAVGIALALGLGDLIASIVPKPSKTLKYVLFTAAGALLAIGGVFIWIRRESLGGHTPKADPEKASHGSAVALGAGIAGVELLTAFPYFAAIALIVGARVSVAAKAFLVVLYCVVYVLPLLGIALVFLVMRDRADQILRPPIDWLFRRWPVVVGPLAFCLGIGLVVFGLVRLGAL